MKNLRERIERCEQIIKNKGCADRICENCYLDDLYGVYCNAYTSLQFAKAHLAKLDSEWTDLDISNLPPDILVGNYEWQFDNCGTWMSASNWNSAEHQGSQLQKAINGTRKYRYRKAKQKEPSHEDIMKTDWKINEAYSYEFYQRPTKFRIGHDGEVQYLIETIGWVIKDWFIDREPAETPPEGIE